MLRRLSLLACCFSTRFLLGFLPDLFLQLLLLMWLLQRVVGGPAGEGVIFSLSPLLHREPCQLSGSHTRPIHFEGVYGLGRGSPLLLVLLLCLLLLPVGQGRVV